VTGKKAERRRRNLDRMRAYVATLAPLFRLQHWEIAVDDEPPDHNGEASVWTSNACYVARIAFTDRHFADPPDVQRNTVAHELIHIATKDWMLACEDIIEYHDPISQKWTTERYERAMERCTDHLARVLAPFLPLPPEGE
jgi:hypothetical protein